MQNFRKEKYILIYVIFFKVKYLLFIIRQLNIKVQTKSRKNKKKKKARKNLAKFKVEKKDKKINAIVHKFSFANNIDINIIESAPRAAATTEQSTFK